MPPILPYSRAARRPGFTLVEIMIVVVIIGLLAVLAIPSIQRVQRRSQNTRFVSDLRTFSQAFETYAMENGTWPPNAGSGVVPAPLVGGINATAWSAINTLGGRWNWDFNRNGIMAGIAVTNITATASQLLDVDFMIDDGNLSTGRLRNVSGRYTLVLEE
ncbi:MAG: prepilin-type N-terminal cleavage/methylation domain-containing protein [Cephaloticoccus sp.]|nr:prepilin-type N-terminal cleavage/methylation domain-containing protein [Cephaloticoccus sp.]MCF7760750.1 prepilin-type N-terminal cleavage/methylation domain-containing protein [Cephaloticoccus sp.]